eukprot:CAMPEP_0172474808 /NCGR_PEP_ID=MMETSP1065-20121228/69551_1 /TAXON_ID=265537 /ORGANISM="Amphiprora paludosa, Strain CCMP125" /LENGTH=175 /DNA_ID=CAMNT_0013232999 /DNA_START=413 /DNA_END=940 /DNA_ORIENTATION=-
MLFVGRTETGDRQVREEIGRQCASYDDTTKCNMQTAVTKGVALSIATKLNATFCLEPGGDNPNRKSISDSIVSGCIPVFFSNNTGRAWQWHWEDWKYQAHISVPRIPFIQGQIDLYTLLHETIPSHIVTMMQSSLHRHARQFQYSYDEDPHDGIRLLLHQLHQRALRKTKDGKCQ